MHLHTWGSGNWNLNYYEKHRRSLHNTIGLWMTYLESGSNGEKSLKEFYETANKIHPRIKLTLEYSQGRYHVPRYQIQTD